MLKTFTKILLVPVLFFIVWELPVSYAVEAPELPIEQRSYVQQILYYTKLFGSDTRTVYSVGYCESGFRDGILVGDEGHSHGEFAYFKETWARYAKMFNKHFGTNYQFDINSRHDQIKLTSWVFTLEEVNKREWTTYRALTNGGTYTFYSKFLKKTFTIKCNYRDLPNSL